MHYTPEEVEKLLANRPNQPHYIASLIAECVAAERERFPSLQPVIQWLESGCDPKEAAKELRIYQQMMSGPNG